MNGVLRKMERFARRSTRTRCGAPMPDNAYMLLSRIIATGACLLLLDGCTVVSVASTAVSVAGTAVNVGVAAGSAAVGVATTVTKGAVSVGGAVVDKMVN